MNAIIIAAGVGTRLNPLTLSTPKPLIKIFGKPMIEKNIEYLLQEGIEEIVIVTGYMKDMFEYLRDKYKKVKLIYNPKYKEYNNIYSFYLVREFLKDSYILDGDIYLTRNIFKKEIDESKYFSKKINMFNNEWQLLLNNDGKIRKVEDKGYKKVGDEFERLFYSNGKLVIADQKLVNFDDKDRRNTVIINVVEEKNEENEKNH